MKRCIALLTAIVLCMQILFVGQVAYATAEPLTNLVPYGDMETTIGTLPEGWTLSSNASGSTLSIVADTEDSNNRVLRFDGTGNTGSNSYISNSVSLVQGYHYSFKVRLADIDTNEGSVYLYTRSNSQGANNKDRPKLKKGEWTTVSGTVNADGRILSAKMINDQSSSKAEQTNVVYEIDDVLVCDTTNAVPVYVNIVDTANIVCVEGLQNIDGTLMANKGSVASFKVKTENVGYVPSEVSANGDILTPDEDGVYSFTVEDGDNSLAISTEKIFVNLIPQGDMEDSTATFSTVGEQDFVLDAALTGNENNKVLKIDGSDISDKATKLTLKSLAKMKAGNTYYIDFDYKVITNSGVRLRRGSTSANAIVANNGNANEWYRLSENYNTGSYSNIYTADADTWYQDIIVGTGTKGTELYIDNLVFYDITDAQNIEFDAGDNASIVDVEGTQTINGNYMAYTDSVVSFKIKTENVGYVPSEVSANGYALTPDENGVYSFTVEDGDNAVEVITEKKFVNLIPQGDMEDSTATFSTVGTASFVPDAALTGNENNKVLKIDGSTDGSSATKLKLSSLTKMKAGHTYYIDFDYKVPATQVRLRSKGSELAIATNGGTANTWYRLSEMYNTDSYSNIFTAETDTYYADVIVGSGTKSTELYIDNLVFYDITDAVNISFNTGDTANIINVDGMQTVNGNLMAYKGSEVSFKVEPKAINYSVTGVVANGETLTPDENGVYSFTVEEGDNAVTVETEKRFINLIPQGDMEDDTATFSTVGTASFVTDAALTGNENNKVLKIDGSDISDKATKLTLKPLTKMKAGNTYYIDFDYKVITNSGVRVRRGSTSANAIVANNGNANDWYRLSKNYNKESYSNIFTAEEDTWYQDIIVGTGTTNTELYIDNLVFYDITDAVNIEFNTGDAANIVNVDGMQTVNGNLMAYKDSVVSFKVEPKQVNYSVTSVVANGDTLTPDADGIYSFTVAASDNTVTVTTSKRFTNLIPQGDMEDSTATFSVKGTSSYVIDKALTDNSLNHVLKIDGSTDDSAATKLNLKSLTPMQAGHTYYIDFDYKVITASQIRLRFEGSDLAIATNGGSANTWYRLSEMYNADTYSNIFTAEDDTYYADIIVGTGTKGTELYIDNLVFYDITDAVEIGFESNDRAEIVCVDGMQNLDGKLMAYKDSVVKFKLETTDEKYSISSVVVNENRLAPDANGVYSFTVADSDNSIYVTATEGFANLIPQGDMEDETATFTTVGATSFVTDKALTKNPNNKVLKITGSPDDASATKLNLKSLTQMQAGHIYYIDFDYKVATAAQIRLRSKGSALAIATNGGAANTWYRLSKMYNTETYSNIITPEEDTWYADIIVGTGEKGAELYIDNLLFYDITDAIEITSDISDAANVIDVAGLPSVNGKLMANKGSVAKFKVEANAGYSIASVVANGNTLTADEDGVYSFNVAESNNTLTITTNRELANLIPQGDMEDPTAVFSVKGTASYVVDKALTNSENNHVLYIDGSNITDNKATYLSLKTLTPMKTGHKYYIDFDYKIITNSHVRVRNEKYGNAIVAKNGYANTWYRLSEIYNDESYSNIFIANSDTYYQDIVVGMGVSGTDIYIDNLVFYDITDACKINLPEGAKIIDGGVSMGGTGFAKPGKTVSFTFSEAPGKVFANGEVITAVDNVYSFTMPENEINILAVNSEESKKVVGYTVTGRRPYVVFDKAATVKFVVADYDSKNTFRGVHFAEVTGSAGKIVSLSSVNEFKNIDGWGSKVIYTWDSLNQLPLRDGFDLRGILGSELPEDTDNIKYDAEWEAIPMVTAEMKAAGITGGEGGQRMTALATSSDGELMIAGTDVAGMWRSEDGGENWEMVYGGLYAKGVFSVAIDPVNKNRVLAYGGAPTSDPSSRYANMANGIYLSEDGGKTWEFVLQQKGAALRLNFTESIAYDPSSYDADKGICMVAYWSRPWALQDMPNADAPYYTGEAVKTFDKAEGDDVLTPYRTDTNALWKTTDGGKTWNPVATGLTDGIVKVHPTNGTVYVSNLDGFHRSIDGGQTFTTVLADRMIYGLDVISTYPDRVYVNDAEGVWLSADSGQTFNKVSSLTFPSSYDTTTPDGIVRNLKVSPVNPDNMVIASHKIYNNYNSKKYYSTNGGLLWFESGYDATNDFFKANNRDTCYVWSPTDANKVWGFGGDWVVSSSNAGATFAWDYNGGSAVYMDGRAAFNVNNPDIFYYGAQDFHGALTTDGGETWKHIWKWTEVEGLEGVGQGYGSVYGAYAADENTLVAIASVGSWGAERRIFMSYDAGETWTDAGVVVDDNTNYKWSEMCYQSPTNSDVIFAGYFRSADKGKTWEEMTDVAVVCAHNPYGSKELYGYDVDGNIKVSYDDGATWEVVTKAMMPEGVTGGTINDLAVDGINNIIYYVSGTSSSRSFFKYSITDNVTTDLTGNVVAGKFGTPVQLVTVDPVHPEIVYVGGLRSMFVQENAIQRSTDGGLTFEVISTGSDDSVIAGPTGGIQPYDMLVHPVTGELWVSNGCRGWSKILIPYTE